MVKLSDLQRIMGSSLVLETAGGFIFWVCFDVQYSPKPGELPSRGTNISAKKWHFEDDFPFPEVGYVNSLENYVSFPGTKLRVGRGGPGFFLGKQTLQLLAGASFPSFPPKCRSLTRGLKLWYFYGGSHFELLPGTPNNQFEMDVFVNPPFFPTVTILNHPIETTIYMWLKNPGTVGKRTINNSSLWREPRF